MKMISNNSFQERYFFVGQQHMLIHKILFFPCFIQLIPITTITSIPDRTDRVKIGNWGLTTLIFCGKISLLIQLSPRHKIISEF
jgi:hypothetical protein